MGETKHIEKQYGFRAKNSTPQDILHILQFLYIHIHSGNVVFSLLLNFRKVFDSDNQEILVSKLNTYRVIIIFQYSMTFCLPQGGVVRRSYIT